jgi:hypothetical protein
MTNKRDSRIRNSYLSNDKLPSEFYYNTIDAKNLNVNEAKAILLSKKTKNDLNGLSPLIVRKRKTLMVMSPSHNDLKSPSKRKVSEFNNILTLKPTKLSAQPLRKQSHNT